MKYISTRNQADPLFFSEALAQGLASDGGLFIPERFPNLKISSFDDPALTFVQFGARLLNPFLDGDRLQPLLPEICEASLSFQTPLRYRKDQTAVLELFHGPTSAFKDVGARFLAECTIRDSHKNEKRTVIVATSGDTGGAVAGAFYGKPNIEVFVLYPKGKISARQERQIACWGENIKAFAVHGTFDDCQKVVKEALADKEWRKQRPFISANSISIGRLLPQMIYYAKSSLDYKRTTGAIAGVIVPTGNLGNAVAALWAKRLGFPLGKVILATNANHAIGDYFSTGQWRPHPTVTTLANAMDVGNPSNIERLRALYPSLIELKQDVAAVSVSDYEITDEIRSCFEAGEEVFCPHTATALVTRKKVGGKNWILAATAHPAKFETIVEPLIKQTIPVPPALGLLLNRKPEATEIEPTLAALKTAAT